jgi:hypothetical protein
MNGEVSAAVDRLDLRQECIAFRMLGGPWIWCRRSCDSQWAR